MTEIKLRWHYQRNKVTKDMVLAELGTGTGETPEQVKERLGERTPKVLQQWISLGNEDDNGYWNDVPIVCDLIDTATGKITEVEE
jgi:hypothetical protein